MRITELFVDSFGHWRRLRLPDLAPTVTVIHGPNEAGKSTLMQLVRAVLYDYSVPLHHRFVPPRYEGAVGGQLTLAAPQGRFQVTRHVPAPGTSAQFDRSELSVRSLDSELQGRHLLSMLLAGVDEAVFHNVFAVGISEMQHLATLSDTEAARQLYGLVSGGDRVSIADVAGQLRDARRRLETGGSDSLEKLREQQQAWQQDRGQQEALSERWFRLQQQRAEISAEIDDLELRQQQFGEFIRGTQPSQVLRDHWRECRRLHGDYRKLGAVPNVPASAVERLQRMGEQLRKHRTAWESLRKQRRELRARANRLPGASGLLEHAEEVEALHKRRSQVATLSHKLQQERKQSEELEIEWQGELERIGFKLDWRIDTLPLLSDETILSLRPLAEQVQSARAAVENSQKLEQESRAESERLQGQLETSLQSLGQTNLHSAVPRLERQSGLLRKRIELDSRTVRLQRKLKETRKESLHWIGRQVPSWRGLMVLGSVFTLGFIVVMMGLFGHQFGITDDRRGMMALIGGAISLGSVVMRNLSEWTAGRNLSVCREDMEALRKQYATALQEQESIDQQLSPSNDPFAVRLQQNQGTLDDLLELQPVAEKQQEAEGRSLALAEQKEERLQRLQSAEQAWLEALQTCGLPAVVTPEQFVQLSQVNSPVDRLRTKLLAVRRELALTEAEWQQLQQQVERLWEQADLAPESETLEKQIEELVRALKSARRSHQQRDKLYRQWRNLGREQQQESQAAKRLRESRARTLRKYGIDDSTALKATLAQQAQALELQKHRDLRLEELVKLLGACVSLEDLRQELENGDFEQRLQGLESEHEQVSSKLASLHERRGELSEQLKAIAQDRAAAAGRLASAETRKRMQDHVRQWQILAGISLALDSVRQAYETDRQPETLAEASSYLKRLTSDRYQRIWTPFGESALCVDDQQKNVRRVEELSRGTREQVYLSLRMALASAYARRGAGLPLILDDVFVNFDAHRSHAAAETVCDFAAAGHQVLVFTCHDHIRDVFASLDVDVRRLPPPEEVAETGQPVLREERIHVTLPVEKPPEVVEEAEEVDPELDLELLYGAPEYDPGFGVPDPEPVPESPVDRSPPPADPREPDPTELSQEAYLAGYRDALRESALDRREVVPPPEPVPPVAPGPREALVEYDHRPAASSSPEALPIAIEPFPRQIRRR